MSNMEDLNAQQQRHMRESVIQSVEGEINHKKERIEGLERLLESEKEALKEREDHLKKLKADK